MMLTHDLPSVDQLKKIVPLLHKAPNPVEALTYLSTPVNNLPGVDMITESKTITIRQRFRKIDPSNIDQVCETLHLLNVETKKDDDKYFILEGEPNTNLLFKRFRSGTRDLIFGPGILYPSVAISANPNVSTQQIKSFLTLYCESNGLQISGPSPAMVILPGDDPLIISRSAKKIKLDSLRRSSKTV